MSEARGRYKPYPAYKDSGTEGRGDIPKGWGLTRLKFITSCLDGARIPLNSEERSHMKGNIPYWGANSIVDYVNDFLFDEELILLGEDGAPFFDEHKDVAFNTSGKIWPNNHVHILRPHCQIVDRVFLKYAVNCTDFHLHITGSTRDKLNQSDMKQIQIRICPIQEQKNIAGFLDLESGKIDALIEKQEQLIALLKEKRQAVISHAVTKGLNSDASMRFSGIEWLGDIPAHWRTLRLGNLFSESSKRASGEKELGYPILSVSIHHGISDKELNEEELDRKVARSEDRSLYKVVQPNDLAYNMMRAWQGGFGASILPGLVSPAYVVCNPKTRANSSFFELVLRTPNAVTELKRYSRGITDFRLRLYWDEFKNVVVPVPPEEEVTEIMNSIEATNDQYDNLMSVARRQIELLKERRTALITAAVTGKIDVRDWKPPRGTDTGEEAV